MIDAGLTLEQLRVEAASGRIDTVLIGITDMRGPAAGKRLSARFFLERSRRTGRRVATTCWPSTWT